jgi:xylose isomerase
LEEKFALAAQITGLNGLELGYPNDFQDPMHLNELLDRYQFGISSVNIKLRGPGFMKDGSLTSPDPCALETAVAWGKEALDAAAAFGCTIVTTCPLNDGYDYPFEMDYGFAWRQMVDAARTIASHRPEVRLAIEYKLSDPRSRSLIANVGEALTFARQTGCANVGVNVDFGHALIARENPAQSAVLAASEDRLFLVHANDNDRIADLDLMTGSVHFWETLEFFYYLPGLNYSGWIVTDVLPKALPPDRFFSRTIAVQKQYVQAAAMLDGETLQELIRQRDLLSVFEMLHQLLPAGERPEMVGY